MNKKAAAFLLLRQPQKEEIYIVNVFETEEYAIAVKKGNTELLDKINETLSEMKASGEIEQLAMEYDEKLAENNQ